LRPELRAARHLVVGMVEQPLQLALGQRAAPGAALVVRGVHHGVPLEAHLRGVDAEEPFARRRPLITGIGDVAEELAQSALISPDR
jgi:hypothetical protein